jgi:two-component system chemotaxis sensor kinase CheA
MDVSEYLPMFLAEAREHLQELNLAVVRIEETPDDRETVDEIFRIAHSMKGMSATMGFAAMAALTHQMEDVFELLRQRSGGLDREAIDVCLASLDAMEANVDAIETDGAENLDPAELIDRLKGLVGARTVEQHVERQGGSDDPEEVLAKAEGRTLHVVARLSDDCAMASVRALMVLQAAGDHGKVLGSTPTEESLESFDGRVVDVYIGTETAEADVVAEAIRNVSDVAEVTVEIEIAKAEEPVVTPATPVDTPAIAAVPAADKADAPKAPAKKAAATVRIDADRLDQLMHFMGELVVHRTHLESLVGQADVPGLPQAMQDLTRTSQALQAMVMQVRMIPVESVLMRFPRLVRDLSSKLGKQVELVLTGKETELDRTVIEALGDPIVHLVRNSLDHGLESPEQRVAAGKPATGTLEISARHAGGNVVITVQDDGRGINPQKVAEKAVERGLITADQLPHVDAAQAIELLFSAGFSTAETTSDISGRGVGMDAVRTTIRELGGEVEMTSEPGHGSTVTIRLPLTLAIMAALQVETRGLPFAIPLDRVERTLQLTEAAVRSVAGRRMLVLRDSAIPLLDAAAALGYEAVDAHDYAVIVHGAQGRVALAVERLVGQRELVTRPLPPDVGERAAVSGGAVLSDGNIALIVDCDAIFGPGAPRARLAA